MYKLVKRILNGQKTVGFVIASQDGKSAAISKQKTIDLAKQKALFNAGYTKQKNSLHGMNGTNLKNLETIQYSEMKQAHKESTSTQNDVQKSQKAEYRTNHELAALYKQRAKLAGMDIQMQLLPDDRVRLIKVFQKSTETIRIPACFTEFDDATRDSQTMDVEYASKADFDSQCFCSITPLGMKAPWGTRIFGNYQYEEQYNCLDEFLKLKICRSEQKGVFRGTKFQKIYIDNSPNRPLQIDALFIGIQSESLYVEFSHPECIVSANHLFYRSNCVKIDASFLSKATQLKYADMMFSSMPRCKEVILGEGEKSLVSIRGMFSVSPELETIIGIDKLDTQNVIKAEKIFQGCKQLKELNLSKWNTQKMLYCTGMFNDTRQLRTVGDLSGWDTQHFIDISEMFIGSEIIDLMFVQKWNLCSVKHNDLFYSGWTSHLSYLGYNRMFGEEINQYQTKGFDDRIPSHVALKNFLINTLIKTGIRYDVEFNSDGTAMLLQIMPGKSDELEDTQQDSEISFYNGQLNLVIPKEITQILCEDLDTIEDIEIEMRGWSKDKILLQMSKFSNSIDDRYAQSTIRGFKGVRGIKLTVYNDDKTPMSLKGLFQSVRFSDYEFDATRKDEEYQIVLDVKHPECITDTQLMFFNNNARRIDIRNIEKYTNIKDMYAMFALSSCDARQIERIKTSKVENMQLMFYHNKSKGNIDLSGWDVQKVKTMEGMFMDSEFVELTLGWKDIQQLEDIQRMFAYCSSLVTIRGLEYWKPLNVKMAKDMFKKTLKLKRIIGIDSIKDIINNKAFQAVQKYNLADLVGGDSQDSN